MFVILHRKLRRRRINESLNLYVLLINTIYHALLRNLCRRGGSPSVALLAFVTHDRGMQRELQGHSRWLTRVLSASC